MRMMLKLEVVRGSAKQPAGSTLVVSETRLRNWVKKNPLLKMTKDEIISLPVTPNGKPIVLYKIVGYKVEAAPRWKWHLSFWVHGADEGDDQNIVYKMMDKPDQKEIESLMRKAYRRLSSEFRDGDESIFENMKNDYSLTEIS